MTSGDLFYVFSGEPYPSNSMRLLGELHLPIASRSTDPSTSSQAEGQVTASGTRAKQCEAVLAAVRKWPGRTSAELASLAGLDRHLCGRRLPDLEALGSVRKGPVVRPEGQRAGVTWFAQE